jgi:phage tail-like protein
MRLQNITAAAHPFGNRIDLTWENPDPAQFPGVRVMRRADTHPVLPADGVLVAEGLGLISASDAPLKGETVYYYTLFPYSGSPASFNTDRHNRVSAMATAPYNFAGQMYELLPLIYHRYDTILPKNPPPGMLATDTQKGQLLRFLDLMGGQLDQLYSFAHATMDLHDPRRVDGKLLPLLAGWLGWKTDYRLEVEQQRNEIKNAPFVYETIGLIPTVEATVKRISNWESRTKEFVHNVFASNRPERLNLWAQRRSAAGTWSTSTQPLSLNFAYEGRSTAVIDGAGNLWLFYHTLKKHYWNIWYKTSNDGGQTWKPSQPLTNAKEDYKHPTAAVQGTTLWVFWDVYDEATQRWRINYRSQTAGTWSSILPAPNQVFPDPGEPFPEATSERRLPSAVADNAGGVWLFWLERVGAGWRLKYNRHDGAVWQLNPPATFPLDAGADPRVEDDVFVLFHPTSAGQPLWVFWARQEATTPGQTRYSIAYRVKQTLNPNVADWGAVRTLPKTAPADYHDREPAAVVDGSGNVEVFWSSNQAGSWSIWHNALNVGTFNWGTVQPITTDPYSQRASLPLSISGETLLMYRSNESLSYASQVYGATETIDFRYAGSTTPHVRNAAKLGLQGKFDDSLVYTYDAGQNGTRTNDDHYARDTIGLYLTPDTADANKITAGVARIDPVLREFMPLTDRAVFITK